MSTENYELVTVEELREGDLIDLENDPYADPFGAAGFTGETDDDGNPEHDYEGDHMTLECEYAEVEATEQETNDCTVVYTSFINAGFPHGYQVRRVIPDSGDRQEQEQS
jgi:hypothetical protein